MRRCALTLIAVLLLGLSSAYAQQTTFDHVKIRRHKSGQNRILVDKSGTLIVDETAKKLIFRGDDRVLEVPFDNVNKIVFDVSTHMRGGALSQMIGGIPGALVAAKHVNDYWFYLDFKTAQGASEPYLLEVMKEDSDSAIKKMQAIFPEKVTISEYPLGADVDKNTLKALQSKHALKVNRETHPMPEMKSDKALVVVVCPPLAARYSGKGNQFKLHANDQVVAVNRMGTYGFAYLDPGNYKLVSQSENANGMDVNLEAGKDYYFLQNVFMGAWKGQTHLSQNSKELVMYEMSGANFADWKAKK